MPTKSTRTAGTFAILSAILWVVVAAAWLTAGMVDPWGKVGNPPSYAVYALGAAALVGATALLLAALAGLRARHGGFGALGLVGLGLCGLALIASLLAWVFVGWGSLLSIGMLLVGVELWRRRLTPRWPTVALALGPLAGAVVLVALRSATGAMNLDGFWGGDEWVANELGLLIGAVILAIGLLGIGRWLRSEEPAMIDSPDRSLAA